MKNLKFIYGAIMAVISIVSFTSCGDDDEPQGIAAAKEVTGTYVGDMSVTVSSSESVTEDLTFVVTATSDETVTIKTPSFGSSPMAMPSVEIKNVKVSGADGKCTFADTPFDFVTDAGKQCIGTIHGSYSNGVINLEYSMKYGNMPFNMVCKFVAPKQK